MHLRPGGRQEEGGDPIMLAQPVLSSANFHYSANLGGTASWTVLMEATQYSTSLMVTKNFHIRWSCISGPQPPDVMRKNSNVLTG